MLSKLFFTRSLRTDTGWWNIFVCPILVVYLYFLIYGKYIYQDCFSLSPPIWFTNLSIVFKTPECQMFLEEKEAVEALFGTLLGSSLCCSIVTRLVAICSYVMGDFIQKRNHISWVVLSRVCETHFYSNFVAQVSLTAQMAQIELFCRNKLSTCLDAFGINILSPDGVTAYCWIAKRRRFITGRRTASFDTIVNGKTVQRVDQIQYTDPELENSPTKEMASVSLTNL